MTAAVKGHAVCEHCAKPITLIERPWGAMWVHAHDGLTGLCSPMTLCEKLTFAEPKPTP